MKLSIDQSLTVLGTLDPATSLPLVDPDSALRSVLETSDDVIVISEYEPRRRQIFRVAAVVASALLVVGMATWIGSFHSTGHRAVGADGPPVVNAPSSSIPTAPPGTALLPPARDPNYRAALIDAKLASERLITLPGSKPTSKSPLADLNGAGLGPSSAGPNYVARSPSQYWTASGITPGRATAYFETHQPDGATRAVSWGSAGRSSDVVGDCFDGPDDYVARCYFVQRYHDGVAVRAYAQVTWFRTKPEGMYVQDVDSVDVTVDRSDSIGGAKTFPNVVRTLRGREAQALADVVNSASIGTPYEPPIGCPFGPSFFDRFEFHTKRGIFTVVDPTSACFRLLHLTAPGVDQYLWDGDQLDKTLMNLLGLPRDYGYAH